MHIHLGHVRYDYAQWRLKECRCGARKTERVYGRGYSPLRRDWPKPTDGWK